MFYSSGIPWYFVSSVTRLGDLSLFKARGDNFSPNWPYFGDFLGKILKIFHFSCENCFGNFWTIFSRQSTTFRQLFQSVCLLYKLAILLNRPQVASSSLDDRGILLFASSFVFAYLVEIFHFPVGWRLAWPQTDFAYVDVNACCCRTRRSKQNAASIKFLLSQMLKNCSSPLYNFVRPCLRLILHFVYALSPSSSVCFALYASAREFLNICLIFLRYTFIHVYGPFTLKNQNLFYHLFIRV